MYQSNSQETVLISNALTTEDISIAPGEAKQPYFLLADDSCEVLAFLYDFQLVSLGIK